MHHGIRGEAADADEAFCRELCARLGVEYRAVFLDVPEHARRLGLGLELAGRQLRRQALYEEALRLQAGVIALAHHRDDQAETVLFHLVRGSGSAGVCGMRELSAPFGPFGPRLWRPLLTLGRDELQAWLTGLGESWREDESNADAAYSRNRLRSDALPALERCSPGAGEKLAAFAGRMQPVQDYLELQARQALGEFLPGPGLDIAHLRQAHPALRPVMLRLFLEAACGGQEALEDLAASHLEALERLALENGRGRLSLPSGSVCLCRDGALYLARAGQEQAFLETLARRRMPDLPAIPSDYEQKLALPAPGQGPARYPLPGGMSLRLELLEGKKTSEFPTKRYTKWMDYDKIDDGLILRTRRKGDYIHLSAAGQGQPLKTFLIHQHIPAPLRGSLPLLAAGSEILWAAGVRDSGRTRLDASTRRVLEVALEGPWTQEEEHE